MVWIAFPTGIRLKILVGAGSASLLIFLIAIGICLRFKRWRDALWSSLPLALGVATFALGGILPAAHSLLASLTAGFALRNAVCFRGLTRWLEAAGAVSWIVAAVAARQLFG